MTEFSEQVSFKISESRDQWLADQAELRGTNKSEVLRRTLDVAEEAGLDYAGEGEKFDVEHVQDLEQTIESQRLRIERLEHELDQCEAERNRLNEELREISDLTEQITDLESIAGAFDNHAERWVVETRAYHKDLEEFTARLDELEETVETETSAVRSGVGEQVESLETVAETVEETIADERGERYAYWNERLDELSDQLNSVITDVKNVREDVQADLDEIREEVEDDDDGGLF